MIQIFDIKRACDGDVGKLFGDWMQFGDRDSNFPDKKLRADEVHTHCIQELR